MAYPPADGAAGNRPALVRVEGVSFSFGFRRVLEDVSLSIDEGDFLALLGPNGSGKTTLVKVILNLLTPERGRVFLWGRQAAEFLEWERIGYVPQKATHFDPAFPASAREVVAMALRSTRAVARLSRRKQEEAIRRALELVGMDEHRDRPIGRLSGGQQQRVFIARAIVTDPGLLFLDEPTAGVDAETQERFYDLLGRLNTAQGITIVLVTHDIGIVNKHVSRVACLNQKLIYHGRHEDFCRSGVDEMLAGGQHLVSHRH
ncbi:MAG: metal ABC transporter ATP-binding protein [Acidobacteriota bacterium]|nr:metal ABC transporter ATP-binding protein [Acidobacteriota bacterium]